VNLIYLLEGEEEIGSPHFGAFLEKHHEELACDVIIVSDTSMVGPSFPVLTCGLRGIACLEVKITGPGMDLHSGMFGGTIGNPAEELVLLLALLHDEQHAMACCRSLQRSAQAGPTSRTMKAPFSALRVHPP
jgi:acetylornithine deacetylase/succinyl-diaminopimelate desuccinylase-like protein